MLPAGSTVALKEWAVTVEALERGVQIILMRKGGILEGGKYFEVQQGGFFLYPTYEHQKSELLKPSFQPLVEETLVDEDPDLLTLSSFAEVVDVIETVDETAVSALRNSHIWASEYAEERLHWKPRLPMSVIMLRVHLLEQPQAVPVMPEYDDCESWVALVEEFPVGVATPVLNDRQFDRRLCEVRETLSAAAPPA